MDKIDVFIPTKNSMISLEKCLDSVIKEIPINSLIIIDGGSTDGTIEFLNNWSKKKSILTKILPQTGKGVGNARAIGLQHIETPIFASIDSDVVLPDNWFKKLISFFGKDVAVVSGWLVFGSVNSPLYKLYLWYRNNRRDYPTLGNVLMDTIKIKEIGGFSSRHITGEDFDLWRRIKQSNFKWVMVDEIITFHPRTLREELLHVAWWANAAVIENKGWIWPFRRLLAGFYWGLKLAPEHPALIIIMPLRGVASFYGFIKGKFFS